MSRSFPRLAAAVLALGLSMPFACKCPSSSTPEEAASENMTVRKIDLNKRKALNLRQVRKLKPADKLALGAIAGSGPRRHLPASPSATATHQPASAPAAP